VVKIRLRRMGAKKKPFYRIVVADSRTARDGRFIENIGYYDPTIEPPVIKLDNERAEYWLSKGAQPSDTTRGLLKIQGLLGGVTKKPIEAKKKGAKAVEAEAKTEEPKVTEPKVEEPKVEEPKVEVEAAAEEEKPKRAKKAKAEETVEEEPKVEEPKAEEPQAEAPAEEPVAEEAPAEEKAE
jgi:small subunit ribosomal protein S16